VIELTHGEAVRNGVLVKLELAEGLPLVQGDRVHLQQVILNLIINAIEAMSSASEGPRELLIAARKWKQVCACDGAGLRPSSGVSGTHACFRCILHD
jgi:C4-dicarboxylate-specific signal transduction histidine kinase